MERTIVEDVEFNEDGDAWYWRAMAILCVIAFLTVTAISLQPRRPMPETTFPGWPPILNATYPDIELQNFDGRTIKLSDLRGQPILIQLTAMSSPASQAFSGANRAGPYENVPLQGSLQSIEEYFAKYSGGVAFTDPRFTYVQIIFYDMHMGVPTTDQLRAWARHFHLERQTNAYVLGGAPALIGAATYKRIPGFQLLDKDLVLRFDVTGSKPRQGLFEDLLPALPKLLNE